MNRNGRMESMFPKVLLTVVDQHLSSRFSYETNFYRFKPHFFLRWELGLVYLNTRSTGQTILLLYTDRDPEHRLSFGCVQMHLITLFLENNLDMLVAVRTPVFSWKNPTERIKSALNLGFQSVGLVRQPSPSIEQQLKTLQIKSLQLVMCLKTVLNQ